jgi:hypothetical protein
VRLGCSSTRFVSAYSVRILLTWIAFNIPTQDGDVRWRAFEGIQGAESTQISAASPSVQNTSVKSASNSIRISEGSKIEESVVEVAPTSAHALASNRMSAATRVEASAAASVAEAVSAISAAPAAVDGSGSNMVTNVMSWIATDEHGDFVSRTSTYVNDQADIDWEPSTASFAVAEHTAIPIVAGKSNSTGQGLNASDIPAWTITAKDTVARTRAAEATAEPSGAGWESESFDFEHLPFVGSPFSWLASQRGGEEGADDSGKIRGEQIGRLEGTRHAPKINATLAKNIYGSLPSAIADLLKSHSEFNLGLMEGKLPSAVELELLIQLGNGQPPIPATYVSANVPSLILPSATIAMGGPAATVQGQRISLGTQGVVAGTKTISLQAVAPVLATDFAAVFTMAESEAPVTLVKDAGNPNFIYNNDVTLTAGSPAVTTKGHTVEYNSRGQVVIDNTQTIDPSPVRKAEVAAATNRAAGGGPSGANMSNTKNNGRVVGGILIDGSASGNGNKGSSLPAAGSIPDPNTDAGLYPISQSDRKGSGTNISPQAQAQKAGAPDAQSSSMTTSKKPSATAAGAAQPTSTAKAAGNQGVNVHSASLLSLGSSVLTFLAVIFAL